MRERHTDKDIEEALGAAEAFGWIVEVRHNHHVWGRMFCPHKHPTCQVSIWSTPRDGHNHAEHLRQALKRCGRLLVQTQAPQEGGTPR